MPETRYIYTYEKGEIVSKEAYEVSDEELAEEQKMERLNNILGEIDELNSKIEHLQEAEDRRKLID